MLIIIHFITAFCCTIPLFGTTRWSNGHSYNFLFSINFFSKSIEIQDTEGLKNNNNNKQEMPGNLKKSTHHRCIYQLEAVKVKSSSEAVSSCAFTRGPVIPNWVLSTSTGPPLHFRTAPAYLAESLHQTSDVDARRRLRSADSATLVVPSTRRSTLGDRAFPVALARAWNNLPSSVRNAPSLTTFRRELKTVLFRSSFDND